MLLTCFYFLPVDSRHTRDSQGLNFYMCAVLSFYISLEQAACKIFSTIIVMLIIQCFIYQALALGIYIQIRLLG